MEECKKCEKEKPKDQFKKDKKKANGLSSWCLECTRDANKKYSKRYRKTNLRDSRIASRNYKEANKEKVAVKSKQTRGELKREVYEYYSGGDIRCMCPLCLETTFEMLCIDHINNNGAQDRKDNPSHATGHNINVRLKRDGYPEGFQLLCYNCNITKGIFGTCAHEL